MPQEQAPLRQRSARVASQLAQVPETAQAVTPCAATATQLVPLQQPPVHDAVVQVHRPPWQTWPAPQGAPPAPQ